MTRIRPLGAILRTILLSVLSLVLACSSGEGDAAEAGTESSTESAAAPAPESQVATGRFVGDVVETMDAGTYTYVALERNGERVWAAGPKTPVTVGQEISISLDMRMDGFTSDTLNRTFDTIYFVGSLGSGTGAGAAGDPHAGLPQFQGGTDPHAGLPGFQGGADPHAGLPRFQTEKETPAADLDSIEKPDGGLRVAEVWAQRTDLVGQEVVVRGRVVKYNPGILGRNWLHVQDGSGDSAEGSHDLTVTTDDAATVGDLVTARGTVVVDKDFGAGYAYELLLEKSTVTIE